MAWQKAVNAMVVRTLLLQEARRRGFSAKPAAIGPGRVETDEEALIRGLLEATVVVEAPDEADIRREWQRDPSRFRSPPLWEVSHILVACDPRDEAGKAAAQAIAVDLVRRVQERPRDFSKLANEHSDCGSKSAGGALGQLGPGDTVPEFEAALRPLAEGALTPEPVLTRYGWHVIRMDSLADGAVLPFEAVRGKILDAMEKVAWAKAARHYVNQLVASAEISGADMRPV